MIEHPPALQVYVHVALEDPLRSRVEGAQIRASQHRDVRGRQGAGNMRKREPSYRLRVIRSPTPSRGHPCQNIYTNDSSSQASASCLLECLWPIRLSRPLPRVRVVRVLEPVVRGRRFRPSHWSELSRAAAARACVYDSFQMRRRAPNMDRFSRSGQPSSLIRGSLAPTATTNCASLKYAS